MLYMEEYPELEPFNIATNAVVVGSQPDPRVNTVDSDIALHIKRLSSKDLHRRDKQEADACGLRLRMWRPVQNTEDFEEEIKVWYPYEKQGAKRFGYSRLGMTVLDSIQQVVPGLAELDEDIVRWRLERSYPSAAKSLGPVAVTGSHVLGGGANWYVALKFDPLMGRVFHDRNATIAATVPAVSLRDYQATKHTPHVSLGKPKDHAQGIVIERQIRDVMPKKVHFGPLRFTIGPR